MLNFKFRMAEQILRLRRAIHRRTNGYSTHRFDDEICPVCGQKAGLAMHGVLWPELVLQWELSPSWANWMDQREGLRCLNCRSNLRCRQLAKCILSEQNSSLGVQAKSLRELCLDPKMRSLRVAEINSAGDLHPFLAMLPLLHYSEYGSTNPAIPSEDLHNLSYPDEMFDLVVTSDVLEHVPNVIGALSQIRRILRPNGIHVYSVPVDWTKNRSKRRANFENGEIQHIYPPSYHGFAGERKNDFLVFHEFGRDFVQICENVGFSVSLREDSRNPALVTFVAKRNG